jgi:hypothetical protein
MLSYEYKLRLSRAQQAAIDEAIRTTQFIRNTCARPLSRRYGRACETRSVGRAWWPTMRTLTSAFSHRAQSGTA